MWAMGPHILCLQTKLCHKPIPTYVRNAFKSTLGSSVTVKIDRNVFRSATSGRQIDRDIHREIDICR